MNVTLVIPCYNEEEVLPETVRQLLSFYDELRQKTKLSSASKIYFVDDGSKDKTWSIIEQLSKKHECIRGIKLSRNCGHQNALMAGLLEAEGDALISIDADLQDDITVIEAMIDFFTSGYEVVYGVRKSRDVDTFFKKKTAESFYSLMRYMGVELIYNHADYRLLSRKAVEALKLFEENNLFLRGIVPLIGFKSTEVYYERKERFAGKTKYPLKKMLSFAWDGITSFSVVPLRIISALGFLTFFFTVLMSFWILYIKIFTNSAIPGWASSVLPIYFIGGIQILCLGIVGEYLGKVFGEVKNRPRYIIEKVL